MTATPSSLSLRLPSVICAVCVHCSLPLLFPKASKLPSVLGYIPNYDHLLVSTCTASAWISTISPASASLAQSHAFQVPRPHMHI